jgi:hypothetical protein
MRIQFLADLFLALINGGTAFDKAAETLEIYEGMTADEFDGVLAEII